MTKHKLDEVVEEVLLHFGVKGMKWGVKRADEQSASDEGAGGGGGEPDESLIEAMSEKLENISDSIKKKGKALIDKLFGGNLKEMKGKDKANFIKGFKKGIEDSNAADKKNKLTPSQKRRAEGEARLKKEMDSLTKTLEKQGYKKVPKAKKEKETRTKNKDGSTTIKTKKYTTTVKTGTDADVSKAISDFKKKNSKK